MAVQVFIVDDYELILESIAALLTLHTLFGVAGMATNGADAIPLICSENPDIIIMDAVMPQMDGFEATRLLMQKRPASRVIILSPSTTPDGVAQALAAARVGLWIGRRTRRSCLRRSTPCAMAASTSPTR